MMGMAAKKIEKNQIWLAIQNFLQDINPIKYKPKINIYE